ncbi:hypothetical protein M0813_25152 [Anaeramoeba flamelloides]|uniref:BTB domain-containing protein n=1 Tax=Anaeramoeba flamelloides TaxID=1746091 RepID=A0ABQ8Y3Y6_9EUKA|nr:hypothetical protein M0813_25152 [Anaeramoeba flamelloides]
MTNIKSIGGSNANWEQKSEFPTTLDPIIILPEEIRIVHVVVSNSDQIVFLSSEGKLYQSTPGINKNTKLKAFENVPPMKSLDSGYFHFLALSDEEKPKVYAWGQNGDQQLGFKNNFNDVKKPTLVEPLKEENIDQVCCIGYCSFFLNKTTNVLFGSGNTSHGKLGKPEITESSGRIQKLHENVTNVFGGHSDHTFITKTDGKLYGFGLNQYGDLGLGNTKDALTPTQIKLEFPVEDISKIRLAYRYSAILTKYGKLYVTGEREKTGFEKNLTKFEQYPQFKNNNTIIRDIDCGYEMFVVLTQDNEIWVKGLFGGSNSNNSNTIRKIRLETNVTNDLSSYDRIKCSEKHLIFFLQSNSYLAQDLEKLLEEGYFSDCDIQSIPAHKILIETRLGHDFDEIKKYLESNCKLKEIQDLLKWIYCGEMINLKRIEEILNHFGIQNPQKTKLLKNDLKKLLFDEETSDFTLVVKNDEDDDENEDEEQEDEEDEELLPIHKFILAARSGLFLDMFQNLDQNIQKVKDYSGKSLETMELLISFLYTDELPITADTDQEFIKEEFEDIVEYYQLNPTIPILDIFERCSKK